VRDHLKASFDRNKKRYDSRVKSSHFDVGDFVYYVPKNHYGKNRKWAMDNRGPYRVERRVNQVNYVIRRSPTAAPIIVHIDRLSRYYLPKEADGITDKLPPVWKTRSTAQNPGSAAETQPKTDASEGQNVQMDVSDRASATRIPGTAVSSSPPTTAVTVGDTAARDQSTCGQEVCQQEETMERSAAPAQLLDHETNGTQIQPTCHMSGSDAVSVQAPTERSSQQLSPIPDVEDRWSGVTAASHAGKRRPSLPDHSGMYEHV